MRSSSLACLAAAIAISLSAGAQAPAVPPAAVPPAVVPPAQDQGPVVLDWTPPALAQLSTTAAVKNSFTLDRNMLSAASSLLPDSDAPTKQAIAKLDGVSVHMFRFGAAAVPDETAIGAIRDAYHLRGWKHVVTTSTKGSPVHTGTTDVWVVMDGVNIRGAVVLADTPKSVTLVTVKGEISPVDLMHLRGHFGIPKFDGDNFGASATP